MIGAIIGAGLSIAGSVAGASASANAAKEAQQASEENARIRYNAHQKTTNAISKAHAEEKAASRAAESAPRYAMKAVLDQTAEKIRQRNADRRGKAKLGMQTAASAQAGAAQDMETLGNVEQQAIAQGLDARTQARKEQRISDANYNVTMAQREQAAAEIAAGQAAQDAAFNQQRANATAQAIQGVASAAGSLAGAIDSKPTVTKSNATGVNTTTNAAKVAPVTGGTIHQYANGKKITQGDLGLEPKSSVQILKENLERNTFNKELDFVRGGL